MDTSRSPVSREDISHLWTAAANCTADPRTGIFGPSSIGWKVNRESGLFLGAGRAALLQLAHPWVAAALDQHSNLRADPLVRFHNTFRVVFTMIFGTLEQALASSRYLYQLHTRVLGEIPESVAAYERGSHYEANEIGALCWVYATLVESALLAYESVLPPLSPGEREAYYGESKRLAALFGIPASALPTDWSAFEAYNRTMWASNTLGVNTLSREMAHRILHGRGSWVPVPHWYRALTAAWMPDGLREAFALTYGKREERAATCALRWLPRVYRRIPDTLRYVGPYQEARACLQACSVGLLTRANNRFWMGQPRMLSPNPNAKDLV
ncbi:oxygenase MpaB family protein [Edaphobacter aggregans]|uniref:oxygenase MpaB family protein n=1 Tax=Edaphobacter aggregans TaxID=570835 RepID=UPI0009FE2AC9|nr:oxygenase MpaB family protein [Edaphobacter aggregans]